MITAHAATAPHLITYQGKVLVNDQVATTTLSVKLLLYTASSGGSVVYTASGTVDDTQAVSISPHYGFFSVNLGDTGTNSIDSELFKNNQTLYLEVVIGGETLSPRKQITSAPYAFNATYLGGVAATSTASTSTYIPISDANGNFNFNSITSTHLHITGGPQTSLLQVINGSILASGTIGDVPASGAGTRLMWIPSKAAIRAGKTITPYWESYNIGTSSAAFGESNIASGQYTFSAGYLNSASGQQTMALGYANSASGLGAQAYGTLNQAVGDYATVIGYQSRASSTFAIALGFHAYAGDLGYANAFGYNVSSTGQYATALGSKISVSGEASLGIGLDLTARTLSANNTFAVVGGNSLFGTTTAPSTPYRVFIDGSTSTSPGLGVNGYVKASGFITGSTTLDLAETYPISPLCAERGTCPEVGDVVCLATGTNVPPGAIETCAHAADPLMIGIISSNPGFTLGGLGDEQNLKVALAGRVPLKVSTANGPIAIGDRLTSSNIPGVAQKAIDGGSIVAIALENFSNSSVGSIIAFVKVGFDSTTLVSSDYAPVQDNNGNPISHLFATILEWLKSIGIIIEQGLIRVKKIVADDQVCINSTCINEAQLKAMIERDGLQDLGSPVESGGGGGSVTPEVSTSTPEIIVNDDPVSSTPEVVNVEDVDSEALPTPPELVEPTPELVPDPTLEPTPEPPFEPVTEESGSVVQIPEADVSPVQ